MSPLHLLWICPLSACFGFMIAGFCIGAHDADEIRAAIREDNEDYQFIPTGITHENE